MAVVNSKTYYEEFAMTGNRETPEQREEKRFRVEDGSFVVLKNSADPKVGRLIYISTNGLAFSYIGRDGPLQKSAELSIFSEDCSFGLYRLPCDVVSDLGPNISYLTPVSIRECEVKFGKLNQNQRSELKCFIRNHTVNYA
jgi:hypothetical protein